MRAHWYVGLNTGTRELFRSQTTPVPDGRYAAVVGPFPTKRGAVFFQQFGSHNPHVTCVADAERIAKHYATR